MRVSNKHCSYPLPTNNNHRIADNHDHDDDNNHDHDDDNNHNHYHNNFNVRPVVLHVLQRPDMFGWFWCSLYSVASRYVDDWQRLRVL